MLFQPPLPDKYSTLTEDQMCEAILQRKRSLGSRLVILGHHYQQHDVIRFADFTGDSLKLSQIGSQQAGVEYIIFCGVHFMAESADILTDESVAVILPDLSAGCSMADMADIDQLEEAWDVLTGGCEKGFSHQQLPHQRASHQRLKPASGGSHQPPIPITYVNSTASIKAFCGAHNGACCTSSNAAAILEWAFRRGEQVVFLPDQHLGRNTAYAMGIPLEDMVVYDPRLPAGGLTPQQIRDAKVVLWQGHCSVHALFTTKQCAEIRRADPDVKILVHPECAWEVVQMADLAGSTEFIIKTVREAPPGSKWAIGTEMHLVDRLTQTYPEKSIRSLAGIQCLCTTMYRIDLKHLLWVLAELVAGRIVNQIKVDADTRRMAVVALQRMLANVSQQPVAIK